MQSFYDYLQQKHIGLMDVLPQVPPAFHNLPFHLWDTDALVVDSITDSAREILQHQRLIHIGQTSMTDTHLHVGVVPNLSHEKFDGLNKCAVNSLSPSMILPFRILFIGFVSLGIEEENLGICKSETQTGLLRDVDVIISFQAQYHRGRATMPSKILVEVVLQVGVKLESAIQVKMIFLA